MGEFRGMAKWLGAAALVIIVLVVLSQFVYLVSVPEGTVIVQFYQGRIMHVGGAGMYLEMGLFKTYETYSLAGLRFNVVDPEVLTTSLEGEEAGSGGIGQAIGIHIAGDVFRPAAIRADFIKTNWARYKNVWLDDESLIGKYNSEGELQTLPRPVMHDLAKQAAKVCVGERTFAESVVGKSRDDLRNCICDQMQEMAAAYGLETANVVVPDIQITEEQRVAVDAIGNARMETEKAREETKRVKAEAERKSAEQKGKIMVEQSEVQERARQDAATWQLKEVALLQQRAAIEAEKSNDLLVAERNFKIAEVRKAVAEQDAAAKLAPELARALMMEANPGYLHLMEVGALVKAYSGTEKWVISEELDPVLIMGREVFGTYDVAPDAPAP